VFQSVAGISDKPFLHSLVIDHTDTIAATALPVLELDGTQLGEGDDDLSYTFGLASQEELDRGEVTMTFTMSAPGPVTATES
jgi:hypothetical protein